MGTHKLNGIPVYISVRTPLYCLFHTSQIIHTLLQVQAEYVDFSEAAVAPQDEGIEFIRPQCLSH